MNPTRCTPANPPPRRLALPDDLSRTRSLEEVTGVRHWWFSEVVRQDPLLPANRQLIYGLWHTDDPLAQQGLLLDLIETFRRLPTAPGSGRRAPLRAVRDYLHDNYMRAMTLDELAQVAALSPYHFQRQFKAHFHVTPHQMLMAIRLWRAKAFLTHGMPAAEVAAAAGLTDQSHLTRAFTRRYGITPVRYQKQVAALMRNLIQYSRIRPSYTDDNVNTCGWKND
jgi:AraC-like DNA-binding protein